MEFDSLSYLLPCSKKQANYDQQERSYQYQWNEVCEGESSACKGCVSDGGLDCRKQGEQYSSSNRDTHDTYYNDTDPCLSFRFHCIYLQIFLDFPNLNVFFLENSRFFIPINKAKSCGHYNIQAYS